MLGFVGFSYFEYSSIFLYGITSVFFIGFTEFLCVSNFSYYSIFLFGVTSVFLIGFTESLRVSPGFNELCSVRTVFGFDWGA